MGTVWFATALREIADEFDLVLQEAPHSLDRPPVDRQTHIYFDGHTRLDVATLPPFRGSHMVRDLRDVVVSGYHYHLWTDETWANRPLRPSQLERFGLELGGAKVTYVELLNSRSKSEGLLIEIARLQPVCSQLASWDFDDPRFLEMKFEDMMSDGHRVANEMFRWWGFRDEDAERATEIIMSRHISQIRKRGLRDPHLRSGMAGQWVEEFDEVHVEAAKTAFGDLLIPMGYEDDLEW
jgi:hypothetical protein